MKKSQHPIQPLVEDADGVLRFKKNAIVSYLIDNGRISLSDLAQLEFSREDREQFAQLIGYSLSGFSELGYARAETCEAAEQMYKDKELSSANARIAALRAQLKEARGALKRLVRALRKG